MLLRTILFAFIAIMPSLSVHAETWHKLVIRDEVTISFPKAPEHKIVDGKGKETYVLEAEGYALMVGIAPDAIENYGSYLKASDSEQVDRALKILEGVANGKISSKKQHLISMNSFRSGKSVGLDVEYATTDPSDPNSRKRFSTLFLVKNTLYIFDCWYLDDTNHDLERDYFFNSLLIKE